MIAEQGANKRPVALLLAAHGERSSGAANAGVAQLAATLHGRAVAPEVAIGFIKGEPTITESVRALHADEIVVYPLFLSDGYFTRARLPEMLNEAMRADRPRRIRMLPPLGLDPALVMRVLRGPKRPRTFVWRVDTVEDWSPVISKLLLNF